MLKLAGGAALTGCVPTAPGADSIGWNSILRRELIPDAVIIESLDLFERGGNWFIRARSKDGAEGWSVGHPSKMALSHPVFTRVIARFMRGKDARDLDRLVGDVYSSGSNYKMQGQLFWVAVAVAEFALLDLLGRVAERSAAELLGGIRRRRFDLYIANNHRHRGPEESLRRIVTSVESINAKAVKFKVGGRMKNEDQIPGRTKKLIPLVANALGDRCTIYADANSSYTSVKRAIEVGRMLEDNGMAFYEEPVPFDHLDETRQVADALKIPVAWGEQESSHWRFRWMIENSSVRVFQPDLFYYGGLIRSLRVAKVAARKGYNCTPHISGGGLGFLYTGIYAACCPNPGPHQEYKGLTRNFPWDSTGSAITVRDGAMTVPDGFGIGVEIDSDYLSQARRLTSSSD